MERWREGFTLWNNGISVKIKTIFNLGHCTDCWGLKCQAINIPMLLLLCILQGTVVWWQGVLILRLQYLFMGREGRMHLGRLHLKGTTVWDFSQLVGSWDGPTWGSKTLLRSLPRRFHPEICCGKLPRCTIHHSGWSGHRRCTTSHLYGSGRNYLVKRDTTSSNKVNVMWQRRSLPFVDPLHFY